MKDLTLPKEGEQGVTISWESSNQEVVNNDGEIQRPAFGEAPIAVTLTAHLKKGEASQEKAFELTVLPETFKGLVAHYNFEDNLSDSTGNVEDGTLTGNRLNNTGGTIDFVEGQSGKAAKFDGESGVKLPDGLINSYSYSVALWLKPSDLSGYTTSFFGASANNSWVSLLPNGFGDETLLWSGEEWFDGSTGMQIPLDEWSHVVFTVDQGALTIYINGEKVSEMPKFPDVFTKLDAEFGLGVNYWDTPFQGLMDEVYIYNNQVLSQDQVTNYLAEGTFELSTSNNGDDETEEEGTDEGTTEEENEEETVTEDTSQDEEEGQDSNKNNSTEEEAATPTDDEKEHSLPDTATGMYSWMLAGIGLLCIGATAYLVTRRKRNES
ncbi:LamG domain-containing protein [Gracilibacillus salinarum]|uniref:LamG domain-containing protein n=2 Tax=Gracilibacillus salinarum TaxID=2932255 RepID=A0ABY4GTX2_9BACI|nr:LamG domain-containing protein [Gracilibacillus salinarum]